MDQYHLLGVYVLFLARTSALRGAFFTTVNVNYRVLSLAVLTRDSFVTVLYCTALKIVSFQNPSQTVLKQTQSEAKVMLNHLPMMRPARARQEREPALSADAQFSSDTKARNR